MQYETRTAYKDISYIFLITSYNNSLNKSVKQSLAPWPYLVFDCLDGSQKAINVFSFSKKQVAEIIDETKRRAALVGNEINIPSGAELVADLVQRSKKKKK